ncbi:unnamed protein product [Rotaria magnacalcarata]|uniref:Uncharacterized protein n=1 Tax=Rotaria magnacalcarata TaxID=392030 RepID=A0A816PUL1_9BILA|nr:unnamed protein product [Rotaria magnacalcarata]
MDGNDTQLLQDEQENTIIIDFGSLSNLKNQHNIIVRMSNMLTKNIPVDTSFVSFLHPTLIADRSNVTDRKEKKGSEFTDVKIFIDSLLIGYQTNKTIEFEIERSPMTCTPIRRDSIFSEYGIPLEWNFLFKRQYWHPENVNYHTHSYNSRNSSPQLNANSNGKSIVRVNHLVKTFDPDKIAVNDVSLDLFENQIT